MLRLNLFSQEHSKCNSTCNTNNRVSIDTTRPSDSFCWGVKECSKIVCDNDSKTGQWSLSSYIISIPPVLAFPTRTIPLRPMPYATPTTSITSTSSAASHLSYNSCRTRFSAASRKFPIKGKFSTSLSASAPSVDDSVDDGGDDKNQNSENSFLNEAQRKIEQQQKQIETLLQLMQQQRSPEPQQPQQKKHPNEVTSSTKQLWNDNNNNDNGNNFVADQAPSSSDPPLPATTTTTTTAMAPLQAMLFIDGTWLYYSIHERKEQDCPIIQKFGKGWQQKYYFDWSKLPRILCYALQKQQQNIFIPQQSPSDTSSPSLKECQVVRPIEIVRTMVFTSYKSDTSPHSYRYKMYEDMADANYDVHMMETVGKSEKCVDIQLAVEMLHYATVPNAYDVALLLTGDKDFMPAMIRTRQKGRRLGLVSMKRGCNRALYESPNVKDYSVIWIEDYLDELILPKTLASQQQSRTGALSGRSKPRISGFTLMKVINDFISKSGLDRVSSRDIGKYLKRVKIGNHGSLLSAVKEGYGGLYQFLVVCGVFDVINVNRDNRSIFSDPQDKSYYVGLKSQEEVEKALYEEAKKTHLTKEEKDFFNNDYSLAILDNKQAAYPFTLKILRLQGKINTIDGYNTDDDDDEEEDDDDEEDDDEEEGDEDDESSNDDDESEIPFILPEDLSRDYTACTVVQLKERCRERGLPVSGTKAILVERVQNDVNEQVARLEKEFELNMERKKKARVVSKKRSIGSPSSSMTSADMVTSYEGGDDNDAGEVEAYNSIKDHLQSLVMEYLKARGGKACSRNIGRYLAANHKSSASSPNPRISSALQELKLNYGSLANFVGLSAEKFIKVENDNEPLAFHVALRSPSPHDLETTTATTTFSNNMNKKRKMNSSE